MPRTVYNKLVRDKIPDIIAEKGQASRTRLLSESEYRDYLRLKLQEEMKEFLESNDIEELADLVEVIRAMLKVDGRTWDEMEEIRLAKRAERGGFDERICLESVGGGECIIIARMKNGEWSIFQNSTLSNKDDQYVITRYTGEQITLKIADVESVDVLLQEQIQEGGPVT